MAQAAKASVVVLHPLQPRHPQRLGELGKRPSTPFILLPRATAAIQLNSLPTCTSRLPATTSPPTSGTAGKTAASCSKSLAWAMDAQAAAPLRLKSWIVAPTAALEDGFSTSQRQHSAPLLIRMWASSQSITPLSEDMVMKIQCHGQRQSSMGKSDSVVVNPSGCINSSWCCKGIGTGFVRKYELIRVSVHPTPILRFA